MTNLDEKKLINLKEASDISGYSPDYIGQLIRAGKIPGKQVYTGITWMTTAQAVVDYKNKKNINKNEENQGILEKIGIQKRKIGMEFDILKLFFTTFRHALPVLLVVIVSFILLSVYLISVFTDNNNSPIEYNTKTKEEIITY